MGTPRKLHNHLGFATTFALALSNLEQVIPMMTEVDAMTAIVPRKAFRRSPLFQRVVQIAQHKVNKPRIGSDVPLETQIK